MALTFSASTDKVDYGSGSSIDDLDPVTILLWVFQTTAANFDFLIAKNNDVRKIATSGSIGNIQFIHQRATTDLQYITNDTPLTTDEWNFLAVTFDSSNSANDLVRIYRGDLTEIASTRGLGTTTDGSGAFTSDASGNLTLGNKSSGRTFQGAIAIGAYVAAEYTLNQVRAWQFRPRVDANTKFFTHLGFAGTGTQPDWSGNGNSGTVTGATVSDHVSLGPPFGFDLGFLGNVAAVAPPAGRIMSSLVAAGGLVGEGGIAGRGGGLAG